MKCLKVNDNFALIFINKISFLSSVMQNCKMFMIDFLGLIIYVKYLRSYLQKTWRVGQKSLSFCVLANKLVPRNKEKITFLSEVWGKYWPNISLSFIFRKYSQSVLRAMFNCSFESHLHPVFSLLELQLNHLWVCLCSRLCSSCTQIYDESESDQTCSHKYIHLK